MDDEDDDDNPMDDQGVDETSKRWKPWKQQKRLSIVVPTAGEEDPRLMDENDMGSPTSGIASPKSPNQIASPTSLHKRRLWRHRIQNEAPKHQTSVPAEHMIHFFEFVAKKTVTYRFVPLYFLFLIVFTTGVLLPRGDTICWTRNGIESNWFNLADDVSSIDLYDLLPAIQSKSKIFEGKEQDQLRPVLGLVIRQSRRKLEPCYQHSVTIPQIQEKLPKLCFTHEWDDSPMPYVDPLTGKNGSFVVSDYPSMERTGPYRTYVDTIPEYVQVFEFDIENASSAHDRLDFLIRTNWIRKGVGVVIVEAFFVNKITQNYAHYEMVGEMHVSGRFKIRMSTFMFTIFDIESNLGRLGFVCCIVLTLCLVGMLFELYTTIRFNLCFTKNFFSAIQAFEVYNICIVGLFIGLQYHQYSVWNLVFSGKIHETSSNTNEAMDALMTVKKAMEKLEELVPWCMLLAYFRVFIYLQYNERLGVINETITSSINDIIGVGVVFVFVLLSYGMSTFYVWGSTVNNYNTVGTSITTLLRIMLSGSLYDLDEITQLNQFTSYAILLSFIVLSWLVILNITVSVLANSFGAVFETKSLMKRPRWDIPTILKDIKLYWSRLRTRNDLEVPPGVLAHRFAAFVDSKFVVQSLLALHVLKPRVGTRINLETFQALTEKFIDPERCVQIFRKAFLQVGNQNARTRQQKLAKKGHESRKRINNNVIEQSMLIGQVHARIFNTAIPPRTNATPSWMAEKVSIEDVTVEDLRLGLGRLTQLALRVQTHSERQYESLVQLRKMIHSRGESEGDPTMVVNT